MAFTTSEKIYLDFYLEKMLKRVPISRKELEVCKNFIDILYTLTSITSKREFPLTIRKYMM